MLFIFKYSKYVPILFKYFKYCFKATLEIDHELKFDDGGEKKQTQKIPKYFLKDLRFYEQS